MREEEQVCLGEEIVYWGRSQGLCDNSQGGILYDFQGTGLRGGDVVYELTMVKH